MCRQGDAKRVGVTASLIISPISFQLERMLIGMFWLCRTREIAKVEKRSGQRENKRRQRALMVSLKKKENFRTRRKHTQTQTHTHTYAYHTMCVCVCKKRIYSVLYDGEWLVDRTLYVILMQIVVANVIITITAVMALTQWAMFIQAFYREYLMRATNPLYIYYL